MAGGKKKLAKWDMRFELIRPLDPQGLGGLFCLKILGGGIKMKELEMIEKVIDRAKEEIKPDWVFYLLIDLLWKAYPEEMEEVWGDTPYQDWKELL